MKKILFFGFLIITAMIFVSCIPLGDLPDFGGGTTGTLTQDTLEGTYTLNFEMSPTKALVDAISAFDTLTFKFYMKPDPNNNYKMIVDLYDWPDEYATTGDGNYIEFDTSPELTINYIDKTVSFVFTAEYYNSLSDTDPSQNLGTVYNFNLEGTINIGDTPMTIEGTPSMDISISDGYQTYYVNTWTATKE